MIYKVFLLFLALEIVDCGLFSSSYCKQCKNDAVEGFKSHGMSNLDGNALYGICDKALFGDRSDKNGRLAKMVKGAKTMEEKLKIMEPLVQKCEKFKMDPNSVKPYQEKALSAEKAGEKMAKDLCKDLKYC
ncbi:unnamed protein product [Bursaphelenchus xylophilus]|uniref:(pine wood nematode) hypothetical protein n=1 Tax=Bursaphelenchus xylophilus TaxID=6326 RepID=A0A1I7SFE2_BURXY|nr:unnamed protein product [Bursaphelenchus xylophilus]CAG9092783.1 unnamed protein product [Bursaphelenchus xylophilus]